MIRVLAIDDEPLALKQLETYSNKVPYFELQDGCQSAMDAVRILSAKDVDVIFIDINMPDLNGMEFVKSLQNPPMIVFTTAYQEYAVEGYKVAAVDYLLKPFGMGDVMRAADKVKRQYDLMHTYALSPVDEDDAIFLKTEYKVVRILIRNIIYVEGMSEYLRIFPAGQERPIVALLGMKNLEERLSSHDFMRIHKSYIINLKHISEISRNRMRLDNGKDIPIGDSYRDRLNEYVNRKFLGK